VTEAFLHYVWQNKLFDSADLISDDGQKIEIIDVGKLNTDAGPDFFNARLLIDGTLWAGNVEIHIRASDWLKHNHHFDLAYENCLLHVVFEIDCSIYRIGGTRIPALELKNKVPDFLWDNYLLLLNGNEWIPCKNRMNEVEKDMISKCKEEMIIERLDSKAQRILGHVKSNKDDWEETMYQQLAFNFGFQINAQPFEILARSLPLKIIGKESCTTMELEALLFGQAGFLSVDFEDAYPRKLQEIYLRYVRKYNLKCSSASSWKLLRMRPVNFPLIRIAQFAAFLNSTPSFFKKVIDTENVLAISTLFSIQASGYWETHFHFDKPSSYSKKRLGKGSVTNILINSVVPFLYAWSIFNGESHYREKALLLLKSLPAEENRLIDRWIEAGLTVETAVESQALIQLQTKHCMEKKCLTCTIGTELINRLS
jgi:hypothetical protein